jgi:hypothetical protein
MRRNLILAAAAVLALLAVAQLALPPLAENRIESKLTKRGGSAHVDLQAFPAVRLLFKEGDSLKIRAKGIETELVRGSLDDLDGFDKVEIKTSNAQAGPFAIALLTLERDGAGTPYRAHVEATVTGADLAAYAGGRLGGLAGAFIPGANRTIPIDLTGVIRSDDGRARAVSVEGSVAGIPAGPLLEAMATALATRF